MEDDGFTLVRRKAKTKTRPPRRMEGTASSAFLYRSGGNDTADALIDEGADLEARATTAVERAIVLLETHLPISDLLENVWAKHNISPPSSVLCLGLGSVTTSRSAQIQLALLLLILRHIPPPWPETRAFDPIFTQHDRAVLSHFRIHTETHDQAGRCTLEQHSLVFMPHCGLPLYERIIRTNWTTLHNLTLLANRLDRYAEAMPHVRFSSRAPCIHHILSQLHTSMLPNLPPPNAEALNDLAFQRYMGPPHQVRPEDLPPEETLALDADGNEILH